MKQTAVEWLINEVNSDCFNSTFIRHEIIEKAKAMEKEQIENAYNSASKYYYNAENYYEEIYTK